MTASKTNITAHAARRYAQRCPDGPGLELELARLKVPSKRQWQAIKSRVHKSSGSPRGVRWRERIMVSALGTVVVIAERDDGYRSVLTCWRLEPRRKVA